jgi:hypothetical protein
MNAIRNLIVASSLLFAGLAPSAADAEPVSASSSASTSGRAWPTPVRVSDHSETPQATALSSALLALGSTTGTSAENAGQEDAKLAQREREAPQLRNFQGGRVYLYLGGGATLILVLLLLLILL